MSLAQTFNSKPLLTANELNEVVTKISLQIRSVCSPKEMILFGSAADGTFKLGSDLDILLVFSDLIELRLARSQIRQLGLLHKTIPIDLVFMSNENFSKKKLLGGVAFIAHHEGVQL